MARIAALAAVAACLIASPAAADVACLKGPPGDTLAMWLDRTGQTPLLTLQMAMGDTQATMPMIVAVDKDGAFSILVLSPLGVVCMLAIGTGAEPATGMTFPEPVKPGSET